MTIASLGIAKITFACFLVRDIAFFNIDFNVVIRLG